MHSCGIIVCTMKRMTINSLGVEFGDEKSIVVLSVLISNVHLLSWKQLQTDKCIIHSLRAFGHSTILWECLLKRHRTLQAISSQFTDLKKKHLQTSPALFICCSLNPIQEYIFRCTFCNFARHFLASVVSIVHVRFSGLSSKCNMLKLKDLSCWNEYLLMHAMCWKYVEGLHVETVLS